VYDAAGSVNAALYAEHTASFPLIALVRPQNLELAIDVKADVSSSFWVKRERFEKAGFKNDSIAAEGADVSTIGAGMFDLQAIINPK
jgi:hypothetical protein